MQFLVARFHCRFVPPRNKKEQEAMALCKLLLLPRPFKNSLNLGLAMSNLFNEQSLPFVQQMTQCDRQIFAPEATLVLACLAIEANIYPGPARRCFDNTSVGLSPHKMKSPDLIDQVLLLL